MARINVNLNDVQSGFPLFPDGLYVVEISEKSRVGKSQAGNAKIIWFAKILDPEEFVDQTITWETSLTPAALWRLKEMTDAVGLDYDEDGFDTDDAAGSTLIVRNEQKVWEGELRNNITKFFHVNTDIEDMQLPE